MYVGIDVAERKVSLQIGSGGLTTTATLTAEDALIIAETMKQCAESLQREKRRQVEEARDNMPPGL